MTLNRPKRLFIVAGEASGDLHASRLVASILKQQPDIEFKGWGGSKMETEGVSLSKHYRDLAFMGFVEVLANIRTILGNLRTCKEEIMAFRPDALILVDYPGFNLRLAKFAREHNIPVYYYISPQVWAWKRSRVHLIRRDVDKLFVILPFEKDFYARYGVDVEYQGHPLIDVIEPAILSDSDQVALLPGSRAQEVRRMLPVMLEAVRSFPNYKFVIAGTSVLGEDYYKPYLHGHNVSIVFDSTYDLLTNSKAALVTSGTATLETALFGVPQIVCYKASSLSYLIARMLIKIKFISLVNLVMDRKVVEELIQGKLKASKVSKQLRLVLEDGKTRDDIITSYRELREKMGGAGVSDRIAARILSMMNHSA